MTKAVKILSSPDPDSRTPDNEGRRIECIPGGWRVLNHFVYRDLESENHRRMMDAERQRRHRDKSRNVTPNVTTSHDSSPHTYADTDTDTDKSKPKEERSAPTPRAAFSKPTAVEVIEYSKGLGKPIDGEAFVAFYESKGWVIGKSPMKNWKAAVVTWTKRDRNGATSGKPRPGESGYVTTDTDRVIHGFRLAKKIPKTDTAWVTNMWEQQRPHAQRLLDYFAGNWRAAVDCIGHTATKREGMEWGWPAVMNLAPEFKNGGN